MAMPSKSKIFEHWMDWLNRKGFDWAEPSCWACGKHWEDEYDVIDPKASKEKIIKNWDRVPLQRCHIVARQFGGSDEPSNLFLMCSDCHDRAPNTTSVDAFLLWAEQQNWFLRFQEDVKVEVENFGLQDKLEEITELLKDNQTRKEVFNNLGIHMNQRGKGSVITLSSYMAAIYEFIKKREDNSGSQ